MKHKALLITAILLWVRLLSFAQLGGVENWFPACDTLTGEVIYIQQSELIDDCCWEWNGDNWEKRENCDNVDSNCIETSIYTEELCYHGIFHWYDNTTPSNGACGLVSANYGLNPNETTWIGFENKCDIYDPFIGHTNTAPNLNGYFDDMNDYLTANTDSEWVWGLNTPDKCWRYFSTISKDECYGTWTLDYKGNEVTVVPRREYKKCEITKKVCEYKMDGQIITDEFFYGTDVDGNDSLLLDLPQYIIDCTGWDPVVVNKIYQDNGDVINCLTTDCTERTLTEIENPCPIQSYGPFCDYDYNVETDECVINATEIYLDIDCNGVNWFYTISEDGVTPYEEPVGEIGNCDCTQIVTEPQGCPEGLNWQCVTTGESSYGILDNSLYTNLPTNHLQNGNNYEFTLLHEDGTTTVIQQSANTYFGNFRTILEAALPECKVVYVCANHTSPNGCNAGFVSNLAQYPAYDAPTAPGDVQNNLNNPAQSELWATGWLIDCQSCVSPITRVTITNANDASHIGAFKDIINYKTPGEQIFQAVDCGKIYYQSCDNPPVALEAPDCKPTLCPAGISDDEIEDQCTTSSIIGCVDDKTLLLVIETCKVDTTGLDCNPDELTVLYASDEFEGTPGITQTANGWDQLTFGDNKTGATSQTQATSDVANATGPSAAGILGVSNCGDTHMQSLIGGTGATVFGEGLKKTFTGLTIGAQLCIDFSQAVSNQTNGCFDRGGWTVCLDDNLASAQNSAETIDPAQETNPTNPNLNWENRNACFNITATTHTLSLTPYSTDQDYTCGNWLGRMAIDCVEVTESSAGGSNDPLCSCAEITCVTDPVTGDNYDIEDISLVPCGTNDVCFDIEQSSELVCINDGLENILAFAVNEILADCITGEQVGQNNYFTDLEGNTYNSTDVTFSEDCEGVVIEGQVCTNGETLNTLTIDGVTTYYDLGGNQVIKIGTIDYVGACIEPTSIFKCCAVNFGNQIEGFINVGEGGYYITDFQGNILPEAEPFDCESCIQVFGCRDGRLAWPAGSVVTMSNGDQLDISGLRYTQVAQLIVDTYGGSYEAPSLGGPMGANFSQCQGSSQHELQFYNLPVAIVSIDEMDNYGKFGQCGANEIADVNWDYCVNGKKVKLITYLDGSTSIIDPSNNSSINGVLGCCDCEAVDCGQGCEVTEGGGIPGESFIVSCELSCQVGDNIIIYNEDCSVKCTGTISGFGLDGQGGTKIQLSSRDCFPIIGQTVSCE